MEIESYPDPDVALSRALAALGTPGRVAVLRQLAAPKTLREIEVRTQFAAPTPGAPARLMSRQAVREHLDRLLESGVVLARDGDRASGSTPEYLVNHQTLFALAESLRELARIRPTEEPEADTVAKRAPPAPTPRPTGPRLVLVKGLDEGRVFPLAGLAEGAEWIIGRRRGADVPLDFDPFVSAENASVLREGGAYFVKDLLDSRNGTLHNFVILEKGARARLEPGDVIGVGRSILLFRE